MSFLVYLNVGVAQDTAQQLVFAVSEVIGKSFQSFRFSKTSSKKLLAVSSNIVNRDAGSLIILCAFWVQSVAKDKFLPKTTNVLVVQNLLPKNTKY